MPRSPYYDTAHWRTLRADALRRNPTCPTPGCGAPTTMVDHRRARARGAPGPTAEDVPSNLVALCRPCHSRKTARVDGGFGLAPTRRVAVGADGWPAGGGLNVWREGVPPVQGGSRAAPRNSKGGSNGR